MHIRSLRTYQDYIHLFHGEAVDLNILLFRAIDKNRRSSGSARVFATERSAHNRRRRRRRAGVRPLASTLSARSPHVPLVPSKRRVVSPSTSLAARRARDDARRIDDTAARFLFSLFCSLLSPRGSLSSCRDGELGAPATDSKIAPKGPRVSPASSRTRLSSVLLVVLAVERSKRHHVPGAYHDSSAPPREHILARDREMTAKRRRDASHPESDY